MSGRVFQTERWMLHVIVPVLLMLVVWPAAGYAGIGDSKRQIESQYGAADFIQDETKRIWTRQEWHTGTHGTPIVYGYRSSVGDRIDTCWIEYDMRGYVIKETVLFGTELHVRDIRQNFGAIYDMIIKDSSVMFTNMFLSGECLGAVVQARNNTFHYYQFLTVSDGTKINMHTKISGYSIIEIKPQAVKRNFVDKTWRKTDNYFRDKLYFSEVLVPRKITDRIVIHHTAIDDMTVADIHELHLKKGWAGIGYHKVILPDGTVRDGRPEEMIGAHAMGANPRSIGVVVDGNFDNRLPTSTQMDSLVKLIHSLMGKYHISLENVVPHRDVTKGTSCPGKQFPWTELIHRLENDDKDSGAR